VCSSDLGAQVFIISSDKDLMQLVSDKVTMIDTMKNKVIDRDGVIEKFGVPPEKVIEIQALAGDSSDNVPGAPGIGPKTALQLLETFGDLDAILARAEEIKQPKRRQTLIDNADLIRVSRELVTLKVDTPVEVALEEFGVSDPDPEALITFLNTMGFNTLTRRVAEATGADAGTGAVAPPRVTGGAAGGAEGGASAPVASAASVAALATIDRSKYVCVQSEDVLRDWVARATDAGVVAVDTETDALSSANAGLVGVSLAITPGEIGRAHV